MPPNLNPLSGWISSGVGVVIGATERDACENAFARFLADGGKLEYSEFVIALDRAGYLPATCVRNHDTGEWQYRVMLPENRSNVVHGGGKAGRPGEDGRRARRQWRKSAITDDVNLSRLGDT